MQIADFVHRAVRRRRGADLRDAEVGGEVLGDEPGGAAEGAGGDLAGGRAGQGGDALGQARSSLRPRTGTSTLWS